MKPLDYLKETKDDLKKISSSTNNRTTELYLTKLYRDSINKALDDIINNKEIKEEEINRIIGIKK